MTAPAISGGVIIRRADQTDAVSVALLHAASFAQGWDVASMVAFLGDPSCLCLIAAQVPEGPAQAFLIARTAADEAELITIAVDPRHRRHGLARALLDELTQALLSARTAKLFLEVDEGNEAARNLYASLGALPIGRRRGYYEHGADAIIFCLAL
jgi:ribosomal-protein-alanine N-acetyltransferase